MLPVLKNTAPGKGGFNALTGFGYIEIDRTRVASLSKSIKALARSALMIATLPFPSKLMLQRYQFRARTSRASRERSKARNLSTILTIRVPIMVKRLCKMISSAILNINGTSPTWVYLTYAFIKYKCRLCGFCLQPHQVRILQNKKMRKQELPVSEQHRLALIISHYRNSLFNP